MKRIMIIVLLCNWCFGANVNSPSIDSNIFLSAGTVIQADCNASMTDADGFGNISEVVGLLYRNDSHPGNPLDNNNHYANSSCFTSGSGNDLNVTCSFSLWYYSDPGTWICNISGYDGTNNSNWTNFEIMSLVAMDATPLSYHNGSDGSIDLGNLSAVALMNISNLGNTDISIELSGSNLSCDIGSVNVSNQRYSNGSNITYPTASVLTAAATNITGLIVPQRTNDTVSSLGNLYWLLMMPVAGVAGTCNGTISLNAV